MGRCRGNQRHIQVISAGTGATWGRWISTACRRGRRSQVRPTGERVAAKRESAKKRHFQKKNRKNRKSPDFGRQGVDRMTSNQTIDSSIGDLIIVTVLNAMYQ
jgi:hypothetical protein